MGAAMTYAAPALGLPSAGLSLAGGISEGIGKKTTGQIQAARLQRAADAGRVKATQVDTAYREELNDAQQLISAIRSTQNVRFDSPTGLALFAAAEEKSRRARMVAVSNERLKALGLEGDAATAWSNSRSALTSSLFRSAGSTVTGLATAAGGWGK